MNNFKLEIFDYKQDKYIEYTTAVFPLKFANLLDERLDEAQVMLKRVNVEFFQPFTDVKITIVNSPSAKYNSAQRVKERAETDLLIKHDENTKRITETMVINYVIANDKSIESPIGSGKYNHELYLIELTKKLEAYIGDSITFTNPLGNVYIDDMSAEFLFRVYIAVVYQNTLVETNFEPLDFTQDNLIIRQTLSSTKEMQPDGNNKWVEAILVDKTVNDLGDNEYLYEFRLKKRPNSEYDSANFVFYQNS